MEKYLISNRNNSPYPKKYINLVKNMQKLYKFL